MQQRRNQSGYEEGDVCVHGARMHYLHAGAGQPMLLIHGLVGSSTNWLQNIHALAEHRSVYAIDQMNMGESQRVAGIAADLESTADRIAAMMTALGIEQADIAGHSHGGAMSLMLAARHPERVRSLILFAPANPFSELSDLLVRVYSTPVGGLIARCAPYMPTPLQRFALGRMYGDPARIHEGCLEGYIGGLRAAGTVSHILAIVRGWFQDMAKLKAALRSVAAVPTQLVWGDSDRAVSLASGRALNRELPSSTLTVLPGGGHIVFEEMPEESNRVMLEWLQRDAASTLPPSLKPARLRDQTPRSVAVAARGASALHPLAG
jgi:pimeloyl-ACP methyl ester carboxylesterase